MLFTFVSLYDILTAVKHIAPLSDLFFRGMEERDLGNSYKICFLGYKKLGEMAQQVIEHLNYSDTTIILKECAIDTLAQAVNEGLSEGCQVFVAGSANAEEFKRRFYEHLIELHVDMSDYLFSLQHAKDQGAERIAITVHRKSRRVDFDVLQQLTGIPIQPIYYESETELEYNLSHADCDCVIGASLTDEVAGRLGIKSILIYEGEYTIRSSIDRARNLAAELQSASRKEAVTSAIIRNTPAGIIVTDENGRITIFNNQAKKLTGLQDQKLRGQFLSDVIPALSYAVFYKKGQSQLDHKHLFDGAMVRCIQTRLLQGDQQIGMLTTLQADNSRRKKTDNTREFSAKHHWKDIIGTSGAVKRIQAEGKNLAELEDPIALIGESGTGKGFFAQCIHNSSPRAGEPYITINAATIAAQDAARVLFGSDNDGKPHMGLLELAGSGTVVLRGLGEASEAFLSCLQQVMMHHSFFNVGGVTAIPFNARLLTLVTPEETTKIPRALWERLSVFSLNIPPLRERQEDIMSLFRFFLLRETSLTFPQNQRDLEEILRFYSWPANLVSLATVCKRYMYYYQQAMNPSPSARQQILIHAIGEDALLQDIYQRYPALKDATNSPPEDVLQGVAVMKRILKYNNSTVADKLGLGRTTLWRMQKNAGISETSGEKTP